MQLRQSPSMVFRPLDPTLPAKHQNYFSTLNFIWMTQPYFHVYSLQTLWSSLYRSAHFLPEQSTKAQANKR